MLPEGGAHERTIQLLSSNTFQRANAQSYAGLIHRLEQMREARVQGSGSHLRRERRLEA